MTVIGFREFVCNRNVFRRTCRLVATARAVVTLRCATQVWQSRRIYLFYNAILFKLPDSMRKWSYKTSSAPRAKFHDAQPQPRLYGRLCDRPSVTPESHALASC